ncbi:MAG: tRNA (adenosine(37)-N6)-threonylcarbamoyltransferase complex ATPase subunit type 1 TsaE [Candidatus Marinimicrobia bacterium]|nr:tRNA (adenosine(37)-N6)-threonylcarbamoyltransferase complex ATPase subunit type 1 TsaE [Candidatus Neomarinimicrobiota bacterium]|tara:strand:- start:815 stop:1231 length:417 start_codon:yes stop_codon:yes gene_type:complete
MIQFDKNTDSSDQTILLAKSLSSKFKPGGIYGFIGDLASGKTTFIKGLLSGLDFVGMVNSPTFTLINEYDAKHKVIHIDCYREKNISRWIQLGLYDYFNPNNIVLIEWPEIIESILPKNVQYIKFENIDTDKRRIRSL